MIRRPEIIMELESARSSDGMNLEKWIRLRASELGFRRVGFTRARESPRARLLREWLSRDFEGTMTWMRRRERERADPTLLVPWARTLVSASLPYRPGAADPSPLAARMSAYAQGRDYHRVLKDRLDRLGAEIRKAAPQARVATSVDTGAILEKAWGVEAALGWQGKHTNLIDPEAGSWFFVGEILTDLDLAVEPLSATDRCGTCTRCLEACPTGAFPEPYVLDSRRCISYLTIEHRGPIPVEVRPSLGNWVFGCDVCQEVCPWNADPAPGDPELEPRGGRTDLAELMRLTPEEFRRRFAGTAIRRTGWSRFLRNVAVALGNSGDSRAIGPLTDALAIPDPLIHEHVVWALAQLRRRCGIGVDAKTPEES